MQFNDSDRPQRLALIAACVIAAALIIAGINLAKAIGDAERAQQQRVLAQADAP